MTGDYESDYEREPAVPTVLAAKAIKSIVKQAGYRLSSNAFETLNDFLTHLMGALARHITEVASTGSSKTADQQPAVKPDLRGAIPWHCLESAIQTLLPSAESWLENWGRLLRQHQGTHRDMPINENMLLCCNEIGEKVRLVHLDQCERQLRMFLPPMCHLGWVELMSICCVLNDIIQWIIQVSLRVLESKGMSTLRRSEVAMILAKAPIFERVQAYTMKPMPLGSHEKGPSSVVPDQAVLRETAAPPATVNAQVHPAFTNVLEPSQAASIISQRQQQQEIAPVNSTTATASNNQSNHSPEKKAAPRAAHPVRDSPPIRPATTAPHAKKQSSPPRTTEDEQQPEAASLATGPRYENTIVPSKIPQTTRITSIKEQLCEAHYMTQTQLASTSTKFERVTREHSVTSSSQGTAFKPVNLLLPSLTKHAQGEAMAVIDGPSQVSAQASLVSGEESIIAPLMATAIRFDHIQTPPDSDRSGDFTPKMTSSLFPSCETVASSLAKIATSLAETPQECHAGESAAPRHEVVVGKPEEENASKEGKSSGEREAAPASNASVAKSRFISCIDAHLPWICVKGVQDELFTAGLFDSRFVVSKSIETDSVEEHHHHHQSEATAAARDKESPSTHMQDVATVRDGEEDEEMNVDAGSEEHYHEAVEEMAEHSQPAVMPIKNVAAPLQLQNIIPPVASAPTDTNSMNDLRAEIDQLKALVFQLLQERTSSRA